ncbi:MAG: M20/M25/M40 family metallo-hydrolase [Candidatus Peribacteraceae bacterium]|nr:M20/M25/M40 family metallo-hydrolase [Candidatus Peribacteraceae bacterium]
MFENPALALEALINIPSPTGEEAEIAHALQNLIAKEIPLDLLELQEVEKYRWNVIGIRGNPEIFFSSHLDTVPVTALFHSTPETIYGTGACDAKGQIAVQLAAIAQARKKGVADYGFFFVVGEEVNSVGAKHAIRHPAIKGKIVLNGEPTGNRFVSRSRGFAHYLLTAKGQSVHTSLDRFDSAIHALISDADRILEADDRHDHLNIGRIRGGTAANVVADYAEAHLSFRPLAENDISPDRFKGLLQHCEIRLFDSIKPMELFVPEQHQDRSIEVSYSSDAVHYASVFERVMMFGPGSMEYAHSPNEQILKRELLEATEQLSALLCHV